MLQNLQCHSGTSRLPAAVHARKPRLRYLLPRPGTELSEVKYVDSQDGTLSGRGTPSYHPLGFSTSTIQRTGGTPLKPSSTNFGDGSRSTANRLAILQVRHKVGPGPCGKNRLRLREKAMPPLLPGNFNRLLMQDDWIIKVCQRILEN